MTDARPAPFDLRFGSTLDSDSGVKYQILQKLGWGGNASVFLVQALNDVHNGALFAVKVFTEITDAPRLRRFEQEAATLQSCDHPAIMRYYDSGRVNRYDGDKLISVHPYFVTEYLPATLHDCLGRTLTTTSKIAIICQLVSALVYLANRPTPILHRDIKPRNIFLKGESAVLGDLGLIKLVDPGVADELEDRAFFRGSTGSAFPNEYRTPDLVTYAGGGDSPTLKSDVFQLGLVAATLFTGRNPMPRTRNKYTFSYLEDVKEVPGVQFGGRIKGLISLMIVINPNDRPTCVEALDMWRALLLDSANAAISLDGKAFSRNF